MVGVMRLVAHPLVVLVLAAVSQGVVGHPAEQESRDARSVVTAPKTPPPPTSAAWRPYSSMMSLSRWAQPGMDPERANAGCATRDYIEALDMPAHARVEQRRDEQLLRVLPTGEFAETIRVPVHFHSIERNETEEGGHLTDEQIHEQIAVMNADFASTGFAFDIKSITRTSSAVFFAEVGDGTPQEALMKQQLRRGTASELNLYTVGFESNAGLLGFSSFPQDYHRNPIRDGVVVRYNSLPAHPPNPDRMGRTATHETGHWLGLYHTFQGGCSDTAGDFVVDTAAEATPNYACPANRDTCPTLEGLDPVDNFMDYSSDSCMTTFTPGQAERMRQFWSAFRQNQ